MRVAMLYEFHITKTKHGREEALGHRPGKEGTEGGLEPAVPPPPKTPGGRRPKVATARGEEKEGGG